MNNLKERYFAPETATEYLYPSEIKLEYKIKSSENLLNLSTLNVSFCENNFSVFTEKGSYIILDFGKEICGGIRIITQGNPNYCADIHIRFGESLSEATTELGDKNSQNAHSPRDFKALLPGLSDLTFGQTGFRFVFIELCSDQPIFIKKILGTNTIQKFSLEAKITTNDNILNTILDTAAYTVKLCHQNGVIWDGIKRDRLVWIGDFHQEMLTSLYLFGDNENVRNTILFAKNDTSHSSNQWVNGMPSYSIWWIICLCDYVTFTGNIIFFKQNADFAEKILFEFNSITDADGNIKTDNAYFLDWPTCGTPEAEIGTIALLVIGAKKFLNFYKNKDAEELILKLSTRLKKSAPVSKQSNSLKFLSGVDSGNIIEKVEKNGAEGFSTFMSYYILKAYKSAGGKKSLELIKEYFGGMLSRGATTFWEDFDVKWLCESGRIDSFVKKGQKDIHGDFGNYCYRGFRHSLCHGWSSGVLAFFIEEIMGITVKSNSIVKIKPDISNVEYIKAEIPINKRIVTIEIDNNNITVN